MGFTGALLAAHRARFAALDPLLPEAPEPPQGEPLEAATADGSPVAAVLHHYRFSSDAPDLLWSAAEVWQLFPVIGDTGTAGMDAMLRTWRSRLDRESPAADSACMVNWPSHDAEAIRAFLDHGLLPISTLAVRTAPPEPGSPPADLTIRQAGPADLDAVLDLTMHAFDYTGLVGGARRTVPEALLTPELRRALDTDGPVWLAERGGQAAGVAECERIDAFPDSPASELLPPGRWGYLNTVVTRPRGAGTGRALMSAVHTGFHAEGMRGTYLYYNPPSPLASVFWHRQGYRPLWTMWEVRPAAALR
jgi:hypothetical protein